MVTAYPNKAASTRRMFFRFPDGKTGSWASLGAEIVALKNVKKAKAAKTIPAPSGKKPGPGLCQDPIGRFRMEWRLM